MGDIALDVSKDFATFFIEAEDTRGCTKACCLEVAQESVNSRCPGTGGPADGVSDTDDTVYPTTRKRYFLHGAA
jgi:hypothetical protein